jgi:hypothetical protein
MHEVGELCNQGNKTAAPCLAASVRGAEIWISALSRRPPPAIGILIDLVSQTAHQPPAETRNLRRIEAQILPFRHPNRDRVETVHEGGTAQTATARPEAATDPRTISDPERPHFNPTPVAAPEFAQQGSKIEPPLGGEVHQRLAAGQRQPSLDGAHVETELTSPTAKIVLDLAFDVMGVLVPFPVFIGSQPDDPADGAMTFSEDREGKQTHAAEKLSVRCLDEIMAAVPHLERSSTAWNRRKIRVDHHRDEILDS